MFLASKAMAPSLLVVLLCLCATVVGEVPGGGGFEEEGHARVAVVGAGISGASSALFLRELLGPEAEIVVLEKLHRSGGCVHSVDLEGVTVEMGARQFHATHYYLSSFATRFNLAAFDPLTTNEDKLGIWACDHSSDDAQDSSECHLEKDESSWALMNGMRFFWRYLAAPLVAGREASRSSFRMLDGFVQLESGLGAIAETAEEMAALVGMGELLGMSTEEFLYSKWGITERYVEEVTTALLRLNNANGVEQNAFNGLLELQQTRGNLYALEEGLETLVRSLLDAANVDLRTATFVTDVKEREIGDGRRWQLRGIKDGEESAREGEESLDTFAREFDAVILATGTSHGGIQLRKSDGSVIIPPDAGDTTDVHVTVTVGTLRIHEKFGGGENVSQPQKILTRGTTELLSIIVLGIHPSYNGRRIYRITSAQYLSDGELESLFIDLGPTVRHSWPGAVPSFRTAQEGTSHPFQIAEGLFSTVPMEQFVASMEIQAMTAKNVALLLQRSLLTSPREP